MEDELTKKETDQLDFLHNTIFDMMGRVNPSPRKAVKWDMEFIGEIADILEDYFVRNKFCTAQKFNPHVEI